MIPWPIALLALFYGAVAAASSAMAWRILLGVSRQSLLWATVWLAVSLGAMCGLPLLKPWGRKCAIFGSVVFIVLTLSIAALFVIGRRPWGALLATCATGLHVIVIRYLNRPMVKTWFEQGTASSTR